MLKVTLICGTELKARDVEGGGVFIAGLAVNHHLAGRYLVDIRWADGTISSVPQDQIATITDEDTGDPVEFGNPLFPGHPSERTR